MVKKTQKESVPPPKRASGTRRSSQQRPKRVRARMPNIPRRAILVLGMHRSGTSALTRVLNLCGAALPNTMMEAGKRNPRGYFESKRISELHDELLREAGTFWDDPSSFPTSWFKSAAASKKRAQMAVAVREEFGDAPLLVIKDPRICRLVPFWLDVLEELEFEPSFVLIIRNPLEVAESLQRAQETDTSQGLLLWLQHVLASEHDSRGYQRCLVDYASLLTDWRRVVSTISTDLDIAFPRRGQLADAEIDAFLSTRLRHHSVEPDELVLREDVPDWVKTVFSWFSKATKDNRVSAKTLDRIRAQFQAGDSVFGSLLCSSRLAGKHVAEQAKELETELQEMQARRAENEAALQELRSQLDHLQSSAVRSEKEQNQLREEINAREHQIEQLIDSIKLILNWSAGMALGSEHQLTGLNEVYDALEQAETPSIPQIAANGLVLSEQYARIALLERESVKNAAEAERLREEIAHHQASTERASSQTEALRSDLEQEKRKRTQIAETLEARNSELAELREEIARHEADSQRASTQIESLRMKLEQEKRKRTQIAETLEARNSELAELREEIARHEADTQRASTQIESLRMKLEQEKRKRTQIAETLEAREAELQLTKHALQERSNELDKSLLKIAEQDGKIEVEKKQSNRFHNESLRRASDIQKLTSEVSIQATQLQSLNEKIRKMTAELADRDLFIQQLSHELSILHNSKWRKMTTTLQTFFQDPTGLSKK